MGFFSSLLGWDQSMGAVNAVLASHFIEKADRLDRKRVAREVFNIITSVRGGQPLEAILNEISRESYVVQMNFIALACDNLGIDPPVRNNVWTRVANPYRIGTQVDATRIAAAIDAIAIDDGVEISWPGDDTRIDFNKMYSEGTLC